LAAVCCCDVVEAVVRVGGVGIDGLRAAAVRIRAGDLFCFEETFVFVWSAKAERRSAR